MPLETTKDVVLDRIARIGYVSEKYILVIESSRGNIYLFDRNGKIVSHFNHKGPGPEEYQIVSFAVFDEKNEEIFVFDTVTSRILVYSIAGKYRRTLKYPTDSFLVLS